MKQLLLIEKNSSLSKIIKLNIMKAFDFNVIEKESVSEGMEILEILPDISLILIGSPDSSVPSLFDYLNKNNPHLPVMLRGGSESSYPKLTLIDTEISLNALIDKIGSVLAMKPIENFSQAKNEYIGVPVNYFLNINETSMGCDVFIRVRKGEGYQYIKRLNSTDYFDRTEIEKYLKAGLQELFIEKNHFSAFVNFVTDQLTIKISDTALSEKEKVQLGSEIYELTQDRIRSLDIDDRTVELVNESINSMQESLGSNNALTDFLSLMLHNKLSYAYAHSYLICLLLQKTVKKFEWNSNMIKEKITYMSYFHDISLDIEESEKFHNCKELNKEKMALLFNHALRSAEIVERFSQVPLGLGPLIREHHGSKTGTGNNEKQSNNISPLAMLFMVVEDFAVEFMKIEGVPTLADLEKILDNLSAVYNKGVYTQAVMALRQTVVKKHSSY